MAVVVESWSLLMIVTSRKAVAGGFALCFACPLMDAMENADVRSSLHAVRLLHSVVSLRGYFYQAMETAENNNVDAAIPKSENDENEICSVVNVPIESDDSMSRVWRIERFAIATLGMVRVTSCECDCDVAAGSGYDKLRSTRKAVAVLVVGTVAGFLLVSR
jgi:hypothetical protein